MGDCAKILLDVGKESSDWFPPLKSALGGVSAVIKHYEVRSLFPASARHRRPVPQQYKDVKEKAEQLVPWLDKLKGILATDAGGVGPEEEQRRTELSR